MTEIHNETVSDPLFTALLENLLDLIPRAAFVEEFRIDDEDRFRLAKLIVDLASAAILKSLNNEQLRSAGCGRAN
jgi:hypothetical protein